MSTSHPHTAPRRRRRTRATVAIAAAAALALAACGGDDADPDDPAPSGSVIEVTDAWARPSPMVATAGAVYMLITNRGDQDDALLAVSIADDVAGKVELHESRAVEPGEATGDMAGGDMGTTDSTMAPMMEMVPVDRIEVPAGGTVSLQPGGYHVMLLDLVSPLDEGDQLELTLTFDVAGEVVVGAVVGNGAP